MLNETVFKKYFKKGDTIRIHQKIGKILHFNKNSLLLENENGLPIFFSGNEIGHSSIENLSRPLSENQPLQTLEIRLPLSISPQIAKEILQKSLQSLLHVHNHVVPKIQLTKFIKNKSVYRLTFGITHEISFGEMEDAVFSAVWYEFFRRGLSLETGQKTQNFLETNTKNTEEVINFMKNNELFKIFSETDLQELAQKAKRHFLGTSECLGKEGEKRDSLFFVESGKADIIIHRPEKGFIKVAEIGANDIFGEMALLTGEHRSASAQVTQEMRAYEISKEDVLPILQRQSTLIDELSRLLARRQLQNQQILNLKSEENLIEIEESEIQSIADKLQNLMVHFFSFEKS